MCSETRPNAKPENVVRHLIRTHTKFKKTQIMDKKVNFDVTLLMLELFKIQATILAYVKTTMTDEQKQNFNKEYVSSLKNVIIEFAEDHPNTISDIEQLLSELK